MKTVPFFAKKLETREVVVKSGVRAGQTEQKVKSNKTEIVVKSGVRAGAQEAGRKTA